MKKLNILSSFIFLLSLSSISSAATEPQDSCSVAIDSQKLWRELGSDCELDDTVTVTGDTETHNDNSSCRQGADDGLTETIRILNNKGYEIVGSSDSTAVLYMDFDEEFAPTAFGKIAGWFKGVGKPSEYYVVTPQGVVPSILAGNEFRYVQFRIWENTLKTSESTVSQNGELVQVTQEGRPLIYKTNPFKFYMYGGVDYHPDRTHKNSMENWYSSISSLPSCSQLKPH